MGWSPWKVKAASVALTCHPSSADWFIKLSLLALHCISKLKCGKILLLTYPNLKWIND